MKQESKGTREKKVQKNGFLMRFVAFFVERKKHLFILLTLLFIGQLLFRVYQYRNQYLIPFNANYWEHRYMISQWVVPNSKNGIGDDGLYAYAGYKYVFEGMNPILNSAEVPPLGKYLIGLTILIFKNQNVFGLLTGVGALATFYLFNTKLFKDKLLAFLPVLIFSFEPLFWEQLQANYLDLLYVSVLFLALYFALCRRYIPMAIAIGCFAAIKFPPTSLFVALCVFIYVFKNVRQDLARLCLSYVVWPLMFVLSYFRFFMLGNGPLAFLKVLKYFLNYYLTGAKSQDHMMVFDMLLRGKWHTWWGSGVVPITEWTLLWPLVFVVFVLSLIFYKKIIKESILLVFAWIFFYFGFLLIVPVAPRYLLLLLPFLYNVVIWVFSEGINLKSLRLSG